MAEYVDIDAVKEAVRGAECDADWDGRRFDAEFIENALDFIPRADVAPVVRWVLTDEKLPPDGQDVLCWYKYFRFGEYYRMYQTFGIGYQFNGNWGGEVAQGQKAKVLAWMPLPRPPKMEGGESGETN